MSKGVIAIQMDRLEVLNHQTDTTLLLAQEGTQRGYQHFCFTPDRLSFRPDGISAYAHELRFEQGKAVQGEEAVLLHLSDVKLVWLRQNPPFDMAYLTTTYLLDMLPKHVLVLNDAGAVRNYPEKMSPLRFPHLAPPTLITADIRQIDAFRAQHHDIIIKPLYSFGGHSVFRIKPGDENYHALLESMLLASPVPLVVQAFLPQVKQGDQRVIFIDGEVLGSFVRVPASDQIRANMRVGGNVTLLPLTPHQKQVCAEVGAFLKQENIFFAGIDLIGDYLTEINITSPTGIFTLCHLTGENHASPVWDVIEKKLAANAHAS